jgi:hypothetical protein
VAFKVYVGYSLADIAIVDQLRSILAEADIDVFAADYSVAPGAEVARSIQQAITDCDLFILLWSSRSRQSDRIGQEIGMAQAAGKAILPVVLEPGLELPGFLKGMKYVAAHDNPEGALTWVRSEVRQRVRAKGQKEGLVWLGLGAALLWLLSSDAKK